MTGFFITITLLIEAVIVSWLIMNKPKTIKLKSANSMQNFLKNLKRYYWCSSDKSIRFTFDDVKGIPVVKVHEYRDYRSKERVYILQPTLSDHVATFDTINGRFTIGISENGDELFVSPLGIFLHDPYSTGLKNEDAQSINPSEPSDNVINVSVG